MGRPDGRCASERPGESRSIAIGVSAMVVDGCDNERQSI